MKKELQFKEINKLTEEHYQLLLDADPSRKMLMNYTKRSICIEARQEEVFSGVMLLLPTRPETIEIINIAVVKQFRNHGIGQRLLKCAQNWAKQKGYRVIEIGTGSTSFGQLYLYQKNGFRICGIDKNFFVEHYERPIFENKLRLRDMIRLRLYL
ncbi:GNAT family N-acetyltransferase [Liquorilactobacillus uvarum]|uniref:Gnat family acetyltransferase n=1 Tax=Liquorilactobacillus uvarum DSM 19971 TaxID=1423812 RepID=A0A0R1PZJ6_9LACO|nr:GNAT family N-acetyltransferase [Liquorilactobacillus uvarum]KRL37887.1 gnat family acetyltransferase [Liquorilactobacillus uvarum DSM 19971]